MLFGVAVLIDGRAQPIFPCWLGYVNIWLAITFAPANFLVWWVPVVAFLVWSLPNFVCLLRAVDADDGAPFGRGAQWPLGRGCGPPNS